MTRIMLTMLGLLIPLGMIGAAKETPAFKIPAWIDEDGSRELVDDSLRLVDYNLALHGISAMAGVMRSSEMGHSNYRPDLADAPMRDRAALWIELVEEISRLFESDGILAHRLVRNEQEWSRDTEGEGKLADYPHAIFAYQMHHRAARWANHNLENQIVEASLEYQVNPGRFLLMERYENGRFYSDEERTRFEQEDMAHGMAAIHGHLYAWVRWKKPDGEEDMGQVRRVTLTRWLGYDPDSLVEISREISSVLNTAWDPERGAYRFDDSGKWTLSALGSLLRGHKALYEMLFMFGDEDEDKERATLLFDRSGILIDHILELSKPWGLPSSIRFTPNGPEAASESMDVAALWGLVNDLGSGFALLREREETSRFLERRNPELRNRIGRAFDQWLQEMEKFQLRNGILVSELDYDSGEVADGRHTTASVGAFLLAASNNYRAGDAFERASDWDDAPPEVGDRSRQLYDHLLENLDFLEQTILQAELPPLQN